MVGGMTQQLVSRGWRPWKFPVGSWLKWREPPAAGGRLSNGGGHDTAAGQQGLVAMEIFPGFLAGVERTASCWREAE